MTVDEVGSKRLQHESEEAERQANLSLDVGKKQKSMQLRNKIKSFFAIMQLWIPISKRYVIGGITHSDSGITVIDADEIAVAL
eukprot:7145031-Karenia_brevis.AAC.1